MELKRYKLSEVAKVDISSVDKKTKDGETPVRLCNFTDVYHNWAITSDMAETFMEASANSNEIEKFTIKKGQVAFTKDSETRDDIGISTYIADDFDDVILGYHCALITPDETKLCGKYLNAFMHSAYIQRYFELNATGSGMRYTLSLDALESMPLLLPPLEEQKRIGEIFSSLDKKISINRAINQNLEALAKQLYDYWFVQFDFPNEEGKPYKSSGGAMVYNESLKRNIPEGWNDGIFADIANITMGQSPDGSSYNETGEGEIFYQGSTDFGIRFPSVRMYTTSPTRFAKQGDILMSVRAPVGAVNIANTDCCIGRGLSAINSKIGSITYIYYVVHYLKVRFDNLNTAGTTFGSITKDELFNLPVVIPSNDVIERFEAICKPIFDKQMEIGFEIESLTKQRDELLPLLMNGQVSLNSDLSVLKPLASVLPKPLYLFLMLRFISVKELNIVSFLCPVLIRSGKLTE